MKIAYYDPFMLMDRNRFQKSIYYTDEHLKFKEIVGLGHDVTCFLLNMCGTDEEIDGVLYRSIGSVTPEAAFGDKFKEYIAENTPDLFFTTVVLIGDNINCESAYLIDPDMTKETPVNYLGVIESIDIEKIKSGDVCELKRKKQLYNYLIMNSDYYLAFKINKEYELGFDDEYLYKNAGVDWWDTTETHDDYAEVALSVGDSNGIGDFKIQKSFYFSEPIKYILHKLKPGNTVLDYGCGIGSIALYFSELFNHLDFTGVDISAKYIEKGLDYIMGLDVENLMLKQASRPNEIADQFDFVYATEVLEHLWDFNTFLVEIEKRVKPGGVIAFTTPFGAFEAKSFHKLKTRQHVQNFSSEDINEIAGHKKDFFCLYTAKDSTLFSDEIGAHVWGWTVTDYDDIKAIDYDRKIGAIKFKENHEEFRQMFLNNCIIQIF